MSKKTVNMVYIWMTPLSVSKKECIQKSLELEFYQKKDNNKNWPHLILIDRPFIAYFDIIYICIDGYV